MNVVAPVAVGIGPVTFDEVVRVARHDAPVSIAADALAAMAASRARIEALADSPTPTYGVSTGFGALATRHIPPELRSQLQRSLIRSHAAGSGPEVEREVVRAMMLLRLSTLANGSTGVRPETAEMACLTPSTLLLLRLSTLSTGRTGVRPETAEAYAGLLSAGLTPVVYEYGSLGCSGDLAPLAHVALAVMGEGHVRSADGELLPTAEALAARGLEPIVFAEKEGLALINGTDGMLGQLIMALTDLDRLLTLADVSAAMSVEGLLGSDKVFAPHLHALRPQPGQAVAAANMTRVLAASPIVESHSGPDCSLVQDAYSLRCAPQVAGAGRDTVAHARNVASWELASTVDNPVVTDNGV
jgi:histidine ammonia-lyase